MPESVMPESVMPDSYELRIETPAVDVYRYLRVAAGLSPKSEEAARLGLPGTWFAVVVYFDGRPIGMGRIIDDGGTFFQIVDIAVVPEHHSRGLGKQIMGSLVEALRRRAPKTAYVSLIADGTARHLYATYGFAETAPRSVAMALRL